MPMNFLENARCCLRSRRQANIIATEALECLVLDRDSFQKWLADVDDVRQKKAARDARRVAARPKACDLQRLRTLGTGTFGRVSLVVHTPTNKVYALKPMQKIANREKPIKNATCKRRRICCWNARIPLY